MLVSLGGWSQEAIQTRALAISRGNDLEFLNPKHLAISFNDYPSLCERGMNASLWVSRPFQPQYVLNVGAVRLLERRTVAGLHCMTD